MELLQLGIALVVIALIVLLLRRASAKSRAQGPTSIQDRLGLRPEAEAPPQRIRRKRPGEAEKPDEAPAGKPEAREAKEAKAPPEPERKRGKKEKEPEPEPEPEEEVEIDADARDAYKAGLAKTRGGFVAKLGKLFGRKKIDQQTLDELEEALFTADIGPRAAERIFQSVKSGLSKSDLEDSDKIWSQIRKTSKEILSVDAPPLDLSKHRPYVLLVLGVNGVGKTTTIGKLADRWNREGKKVLLAAGDTFRAAATEQLEEWGKRACTRTPASWTSSRRSAASPTRPWPARRTRSGWSSTRPTARTRSRRPRRSRPTWRSRGSSSRSSTARPRAASSWGSAMS
jgi:flagellar biosynthesis GTPase FlhF